MFVCIDTVFQEEVYPFKHSSDIPSPIFHVLQLNASKDFFASIPSSSEYDASSSIANDYYMPHDGSSPYFDGDSAPNMEPVLSFALLLLMIYLLLFLLLLSLENLLDL